MNRRVLVAAGISILGISLLAPGLRADEIKLKDGSKITGTIVGFEENSFKVKTSYGFAVVQKDQVVSIIVTDASKKSASTADKATADTSNAPASKSAKIESAVTTNSTPAAP